MGHRRRIPCLSLSINSSEQKNYSAPDKQTNMLLSSKPVLTLCRCSTNATLCYYFSCFAHPRIGGWGTDDVSHVSPFLSTIANRKNYSALDKQTKMLLSSKPVLTLCRCSTDATLCYYFFLFCPSKNSLCLHFFLSFSFTRRNSDPGALLVSRLFFPLPKLLYAPSFLWREEFSSSRLATKCAYSRYQV